jgi:hypothetical protein
MSPEQVSSREVGPPADMFAWGSTIVFAGTGRPPFGNESVHAVMERIVHAEPDVSALPEPLRSVVTACLSKDPAQRPTAQQAQASLLGHEAAEALMPPPAFGATPAGAASEDGGDPAADKPAADKPAATAAAHGGTADEHPPPEPHGRSWVVNTPAEGGPSTHTATGPAGQPWVVTAEGGPSARTVAGPSPGLQDQGVRDRPPHPAGRGGVVHAAGIGSSATAGGPTGPPTSAGGRPSTRGSGPSDPVRGSSVEAPSADRPAAGGASRQAARSERSPSGSVLTPAATPTSPPAGRRRLGWAILAGAAVVVIGAIVAVALWPDSGDAARAAPRAQAATAPATPPPPTASPSPSLTHGPQLNGVRSGAVKPPKKHAKPAKGCRDYQRAYTVGGGSVLLKTSVCRGAYTGSVVLADTAAKDGWDVCLQLRGHIKGSGAVYVSTTLTSRSGGMQSFDNGPKARFGAKTTRTEDQVTVNAGRCKGSGAGIQTSWQTQDQLAAG